MEVSLTDIARCCIFGYLWILPGAADDVLRFRNLLNISKDVLESSSNIALDFEVYKYLEMFCDHQASSHI